LELVHSHGPEAFHVVSELRKAGGINLIVAATGQTIQEQTHQCVKNVDAVLRAAGSSMDKVVSATFIIDDPNDFAGMNEEWQK